MANGTKGAEPAQHSSERSFSPVWWIASRREVTRKKCRILCMSKCTKLEIRILHGRGKIGETRVVNNRVMQTLIIVVVVPVGSLVLVKIVHQ